MIVRMSPLSLCIKAGIDTKLKIKCVGRTDCGGYIIPNAQLKLVGVSPISPWSGQRDAKGKNHKNCTAIKEIFVNAD